MYNCLYIEREIADHPNTLRIIKQFKNADVVYIDHYKDVFNQTNANWRLQKENQKLILAKRQNNFYYKGSDITPNFGFSNFYYNTVALNCVYDCSYCYLQGLFSSAHFVLFVNNDDFIAETKRLIKEKTEPIYLALSYDTDLLAIENWLQYCKDWIVFAQNEPNITIELRTKSVNISSIAACTPTNNVILAWTLSPQEVVEAYEPKTPPFISRLKAIQKAQNLGWRIRLCFDPIIDTPNWKIIYGKMLLEAKAYIDFEKLDSISLGVFRMNKAFLKQMQKQRQDSNILFKNYELHHETYSLTETQKEEIYSFIVTEIAKITPKLSVEIL